MISTALRKQQWGRGYSKSLFSKTFINPFLFLFHSSFLISLSAFLFVNVLSILQSRLGFAFITSGCVSVKSLSPVQLFVTPWTVAQQAPLSMEFSRQEHWSGLPFPSPGDPPYPGVKPRSPALQVDSLPSEPPGKPSNFWWYLRAIANLRVVRVIS